MQIKKHKIFSQKLSFLAPVFALFASIASIFTLILLTSNNSTFAAPGAGGTTTTVSFALDAASVDFHFTPAELSASTFKQDNVNASISTNNPTGFTFYVSSIDEDTNLNHTNSSVTTKIASITSPLVESNFTPKSWGYSADGVNFKPIPKASAPDTVLTTTNTTGQRARVDFGVKASPDLNSGTYSKQVLFTATTNYVPKEATFVPGPEFKNKINSLFSGMTTIEALNFKKSPVDTNVYNKIVVSTTDSVTPIYAWFDTADKTIYWWSDADTSYMNEDATQMFAELFSSNTVTTNDGIVDLTGIDSSKTKNMMRTFASLGPIKKLIINTLDTGNVENMSYMFMGLKTEEDTDLSNLNTKNVKDMFMMFGNSSFKNLDLRHFDTSKVTNMGYMFDTMSNLKSVNLAGLDVRQNQIAEDMFRACYELEAVDMSGWHNDSLDTLFNLFRDLRKASNINLHDFTTNHVRSMSNMFPTFNNALTSLDVSSFDTSNVTNMNYMFSGLLALETLDLSNFNTQNVVTMEQMFQKMPKLKNLNISSFDTSRVTNMHGLFEDSFTDSEVNMLDLSNFNTQNVTNMSEMFSGVTKLKNLNISSFNTANVTNMNSMFKNMQLIENLNLLNFTTNKVTDMGEMFAGMTHLRNLDVTSFRTDWVYNMSSMFEGAMVIPENSTLDLSSFNTLAASATERMFANTKIKTIYTSSTFDIATRYPYFSTEMFDGASNLVGGNGTSYTTAGIKDNTYARIDAPGTPGYFTLKP